jgi:hypothetical protein
MSHGAKGGDVILVSGAGFDPAKRDYQCRFRGTTPSSSGSYLTRVATTVYLSFLIAHFSVSLFFFFFSFFFLKTP